ncbi:hypothetical protein POM88_022750 [Heracleum sosnowskyi]|uniref:Uncharacterized protein n=1 Tax=Heracleum sosnowskyi TaxID=360622 RepID=A0AAD8IJE3_9APIA|nr:hypothetical protein POM88_022750 [Heracleum sosnowskyi]
MGLSFTKLFSHLPNAMNAAEITDKLGLHSLRQRHWYIQSTCATSGEGLYEGHNYLTPGQLRSYLIALLSRDLYHVNADSFLYSVRGVFSGDCGKYNSGNQNQLLSI